MFRAYSSYPTQLGLSDFASINSFGSAVPPSEVNFPWCLGLFPTVSREFTTSSTSTNSENITISGDAEHCLSHLEQIAEGTALYDVYGLPHPEAALDPTGKSMQRLGRIVTTSRCVRSAVDKFLYFKHQRKEEDYELRPYWLQSIVQIHSETGAGFFDNAVPMNLYEDFEMK